MVIDLQWPGALDVRPQLSKLRDRILSCFRFSPLGSHIFDLLAVRDGMSVDAIHLVRAYCTLRCVLISGDASPQRWPWHEYWCIDSFLPGAGSNDNQLENVLQLLARSSSLRSVLSSDAKATKWALTLISSQGWAKYRNLDTVFKDFLDIPVLDVPTFADYLFAVVAFLSPPARSNCGFVWIDKSPFVEQLWEQFFGALLSNIRIYQVSMETATGIINTTVRIVMRSNLRSPVFVQQCQPIVYQFCNSLRPRQKGWIDLVLSTGFLTARCDYPYLATASAHDAGWVHDVLDGVDATAEHWDDKTMNGVGGLLAALYYYGTPMQARHIRILLRALTIPGDLSQNAASLLVRHNQLAWFQDVELQRILQSASVWSSIMHIVLDIDAPPYFTESCIRMGSKLLRMDGWKAHIHAELCAWITLFFRRGPTDALAEPYTAVLEELCQPWPGHDFANEGERALGLSYQILYVIWRDFKPTTPEHVKAFIPWLRCTSLVAENTCSFLCDDESEGWVPIFLVITSEFKTAFCVPLRNTLLRAAAAVSAALTGYQQIDCPDNESEDWGDEVSRSIAQLLEDMAKVDDEIQVVETAVEVMNTTAETSTVRE
ncbi:hypothetical protein DFH06DRAFT_1260076 [Mycena polygramma]|nr:hypothetical protein DFH06DRAFT_1260076 [Mycena polygramma]